MQARLLLSQLTFSLLKNPTIRHSSSEEAFSSRVIVAANVVEAGEWSKT